MDNYKRLRGVLLLMAFALVGTFFLTRNQEEIKRVEEKSEQASKSASNKSPDEKSAAKKTAPSAELEKKLAEISETKKCYSTQNCPFSQEDPRAYDFAVGDKLKEQINEIHAQFKKDQAAQVHLEKLGREFFVSDNGFVQEEALNILKDFPVSEENLKALMQGLELTDNPRIVEEVLPELQRYMGTAFEQQVHETVADLIKGAQFVSQKTSAHSGDFINRGSFAYYQNLLSGMNPKTQSYKNLKAALTEYQRREMGG